eukprot:359854-Chlamydomonas_euryale.AAC.4
MSVATALLSAATAAYLVFGYQYPCTSSHRAHSAACGAAPHAGERLRMSADVSTHSVVGPPRWPNSFWASVHTEAQVGPHRNALPLPRWSLGGRCRGRGNPAKSCIPGWVGRSSVSKTALCEPAWGRFPEEEADHTPRVQVAQGGIMLSTHGQATCRSATSHDPTHVLVVRRVACALGACNMHESMSARSHACHATPHHAMPCHAHAHAACRTAAAHRWLLPVPHHIEREGSQRCRCTFFLQQL